MAKKSLTVCDNCGSEIAEGSGAVIRASYNDARRGSTVADYCDQCTDTLPGKRVARRGRPRKAAEPVAA